MAIQLDDNLGKYTRGSRTAEVGMWDFLLQPQHSLILFLLSSTLHGILVSQNQQQTDDMHYAYIICTIFMDSHCACIK
jgi:hypothetical protein